MSVRVSPTGQLQAEIDQLFAESGEQRQLGDVLEKVARLGARLLLQRALEGEVTEFLCRTVTNGASSPKMPVPGRATATAR